MNAKSTAFTLLLVVAIPFAVSRGQIDDRTNDEKLSASAQRAIDAKDIPAATDVAVSVTGGAATLTGRVALLEDSRLAEEIVGEILGITRVDNRLEVDAGGRGDAQITDSLKQRVASDETLGSASVGVEVTDGRAVFSGTVPDARMRFVAREIAAGTEGVVAVDDRLTSPAAPDDTIRRNAENLLAPESLTGVQGEIGVDVSSGTVTLTGVVRTVAARRLVEELVWGINGVRGVVDRIRVDPAS
jgi:hyperosmotically inducible protein